MAYKPFIKLTNNEIIELPLCAEKIGTTTIGSTSEPVYLDSGTPKACSDLKSMIVDLIYPVGSYFITESSSFNTTTKVANYFGGSWTRVEGRFLYGSSSAGGTGGSNDATLVSHNHTFSGSNATGNIKNVAGYSMTGDGVFTKSDGSGTFGRGGTNSETYRNFKFSMTPSGSISTEGASGINANMPAYRTVYMYRRTT